MAYIPTHDELQPATRALCQDQDVVIYNKAYDSQYLRHELEAAKGI